MQPREFWKVPLEPNATERLSEKDGNEVIVSGNLVGFETSRISKYWVMRD